MGKNKICVYCGKVITNQNTKYCSRECRTQYVRNYKICVICGRKFWAAQSSDTCTCSPECRYENRRRNGKTEKHIASMRKAQEAFKLNPNTGSFDTNYRAKSWRLLSPEGMSYEINNLKKWCRDNANIIPYKNPDAFANELYKIKAKKIKSVCGWTLVWWSEQNYARGEFEDIVKVPKKKREKMSEEERLKRKRERSRAEYENRKRATTKEDE